MVSRAGTEPSAGRPKPTQHDLDSLSEADREAFEERAAIMEFDGGLPRPEAEERAWAIVMGWR